MNREQKAASIAELNQSFQSAQSVVVAQYAGLTVSDMQNLRKRAGDAGTTVQVAKNRLVNLAVKGTPYEGLAAMLKGQNAFAFANDPISAAKVVADYAKDNAKLVIVGGSMGDKVMNKAGVEALAKLPSLHELRGKLAGLLVAPASKLVGVLQAPAGQLARVMGAYAAKGE